MTHRSLVVVAATPLNLSHVCQLCPLAQLFSFGTRERSAVLTHHQPLARFGFKCGILMSYKNGWWLIIIFCAIFPTTWIVSNSHDGRILLSTFVSSIEFELKAFCSVNSWIPARHNRNRDSWAKCSCRRMNRFFCKYIYEIKRWSLTHSKEWKRKKNETKTSRAQRKMQQVLITREGSQWDTWHVRTESSRDKQTTVYKQKPYKHLLTWRSDWVT